MPKVHNAYVDLNFTHTRFLALLVTIHVLLLARRALISGEARLARPALLLVALLVAQVTLGMFVIWHLRPPMLTTLHVVNGAALFATTVFITVRASRASTVVAEDESSSPLHLTEAAA
jgi:cytochrome c oxidase assembly protein subunit 15